MKPHHEYEEITDSVTRNRLFSEVRQMPTGKDIKVKVVAPKTEAVIRRIHRKDCARCAAERKA